MVNKKVSLSYVIATSVAVIFTWAIHEFAHWLTSESFGHETIMRLNGTSPIDGQKVTDWQRVFISAAGPLITLLQAFIVFLILKSGKWNKNLYPFLFTAFYMRLMAGFMNFINPNDEGRISAFLGLGTFTIPILITVLLFLMVYKTSQKHHLNWKFQLATTLMVMIFSSILILSDQFWGIRIL
ncbi:hypothetical protein [Marinoscillum sp.]|uniref:hypothetical protein n=1 Tax=Marinoscillum sp. TaxID=2024838 RepID=UPI003BAB4513